MKFVVAALALVLGSSAYAEDCKKFVGRYSDGNTNLDVAVEQDSILALRYTDFISFAEYDYIADGLDHDGDGLHTGKPYNVLCTEEKFLILEIFNGHTFIRQFQPQGTDLVQSSYIDNYVDVPIRFTRVE